MWLESFNEAGVEQEKVKFMLAHMRKVYIVEFQLPDGGFPQWKSIKGTSKVSTMCPIQLLCITDYSFCCINI